jgi:hypothetical protein
VFARESAKHAWQSLEIANCDAVTEACFAASRSGENRRARAPSRNVPRSARGTTQVPSVEAAGLDLDRNDEAISGATRGEHHDVNVTVPAPSDALEHSPAFGQEDLQRLGGRALGVGSAVCVVRPAEAPTRSRRPRARDRCRHDEGVCVP